MAENSRHGKSSKELSEEIERSRRRVSQELLLVREELDLPKKIRKSLRRQPGLWIGAAAVLGVLLAIKFVPQKKCPEPGKGGDKRGNRLLEAGFLLGLARIGASLAKPVIIRLVKEKIGHYGRGERVEKKW